MAQEQTHNFLCRPRLHSVTNWDMNYDQITICALLGVVLAFFVWGRWRYDLVAFAALLGAVVLGVVPPGEAFLGFGHPAVITVASVLVISRTLAGSGLIDALTERMGPVAERHPGMHVGLLGGIGGVLSAFMNNVGALALLMPVAMKSSRKAKRSPSLILMPLAFASILGGLVTLIGTPPNIIIATFRTDVAGEPFGMFDFAPVGGPVALVGFAFVALVGWRLIPWARRRRAEDAELFDIANYVTELRVSEGSSLVGKGMRGTSTAFEDADAEVVGVIRGEVRFHSATWRGRIRADDVLVVEAAPEGIDKVVSALELELVGAGTDVTEDLHSDEVVLVEAVVNPGGMMENRTAGGIRLRSRFGINLLAVSREGAARRSRLRTMRFRAGDVLLLQGPVDQINASLSQLGCLPLAERGVKIGEPERAWASVAVFAIAIICTSLGLLTAPIALGLAAVAMLGMRAISMREAYDAVNWPVIVLLGAMIPIGGALETTGTTQLIAASILDIGTGLSPVVVLIVVLVVTMTLSDIVNNAATAVIMAPISVSLAVSLGVNPDAFLMAVAIGASCAFLTPIGHQNNTLVMGPGGYHFGDYWRMGLPLEIIIVAVAVPMILLVWPL